jgi:hypothetical protein
MIVYLSGQVPCDASGKLVGEGDGSLRSWIAKTWSEVRKMTAIASHSGAVGQK